MMRRIIVLIYFVFLLTACAKASTPTAFATSIPSRSSITPASTSTVAPTPNLTRTVDWAEFQVTMSALRTMTVPIRSTYTPQPTPTISVGEGIQRVPGKVKAPAGLVYKTGSTIWLVENNGDARKLFDYPEGQDWHTSFAISPDGNYLVVTSFGGNQPSETNLIDLKAGKTVRTFTEEEGNLPCGLSWWKERPEYLYGLLLYKGLDLGYSCTGSSALVGRDGTVIQLQNADGDDGYPSPGSDGRRVAYAHQGKPWIYEFGVGKYPMTWNISNLPKMKDPFFSNPAWSPSMKKIAWLLSGKGENGEYFQGIAVIDLVGGSGKYFYPYPAGWYEGSYPVIRWLEDEKYIYIFSWGYETSIILSVDTGEEIPTNFKNYLSWNRSGNLYDVVSFPKPISDPNYTGQTWIGSLRGGERFICDGLPGGWSPDGKWMVIRPDLFVKTTGNYYLFEVASQKLYELDLPEGTEVIDWLE